MIIFLSHSITNMLKYFFYIFSVNTQEWNDMVCAEFSVAFYFFQKS